MKAKTWIKLFFTLSLSALCAIAIFNYKIDSMMAFSMTEDYLEPVEWLNKKYAITEFESNYNDRALTKLRIETYPGKVGVAVLGSSRVMQFRSQDILCHGETDMLNTAVAGASIEDIIAQMEMYIARGKLPKKILLGVDPWIFNINNGQERWSTVYQQYFAGLRRFSGQEEKYAAQLIRYAKFKYKQAVSLLFASTFTANIASLFEQKGIFKPVMEVPPDKYAILPDGSIHYGQRVDKITPEQVAEDVKRAIAGNIYSLGDFGSLANTDKFELLLRFMVDNGARIQLYLLPYHPEIWKKMSSDKKYALAVSGEYFVRETAKKLGIAVAGSYDPGPEGFTENDFFDGIHMREIPVSKLIKSSRNTLCQAEN